MITSLPKHRGRHGGLIALGLLVTTTAVVWTTSPRGPERAPEPAATEHIPVQRAAASALPATVDRGPAAWLPRDPAIRTAVVREVDAPLRVTAAGFATYDERRTSHLAPPVHGWLEKTRTSSLGRKVRAGESLGVIYSAEVYLATVELLKQLRDFESQEALNAERIRLLRWGMPKPMLDRIEATKRPQAWLPLVSRVTGTVVAEQGLPAQLVDPSGRELFTITDPSFSLVFVQVPDADAPRVRVGAPAKLTIEGVARPLAAKVGYVFRRSEEGMRTVRFDLYTPGLAIAQNAHVDADIQLDRARVPAVPESAVVRAGKRTVVYVANGTRFEARDVKLGARSSGTYLVETGLAAGDVVALDRN